MKSKKEVWEDNNIKDQSSTIPEKKKSSSNEENQTTISNNSIDAVPCLVSQSPK